MKKATTTQFEMSLGSRPILLKAFLDHDYYYQSKPSKANVKCCQRSGSSRRKGYSRVQL